MHRILNNTCVILIVILCLGNRAEACSCVELPQPAVAFEQVNYVFSGTVVAIDTIYSGGIWVTLEVDTSWKGVEQDTARLWTADNSAVCGYPFEADSSYLIYGRVYEDSIETNICERTRPLSQAVADLFYLNNLTGFESPQLNLPLVIELEQNFPNPFNPSTTFVYQINKAANIKIRVFNLLGRQVRTLLDEAQTPGIYSSNWDGLDEDGVQQPSGIYFYTVSDQVITEARRMILAR